MDNQANVSFTLPFLTIRCCLSSPVMNFLNNWMLSRSDVDMYSTKTNKHQRGLKDTKKIKEKKIII